MSGPLTAIAQGFFSAIRPLRSAMADPGGMNLLLQGMGWSVSVSTDALSTLPWANELDKLLADGEALVASLENGTSDPSVTLDLLAIVRDVIALIDTWRDAPPASEQLPELFRDASFWAAFSTELPERSKCSVSTRMPRHGRPAAFTTLIAASRFGTAVHGKNSSTV